MKVQRAFYFDQSRCSGCLTCVLACKQWNSTEHETKPWRSVETIESGFYPNLRVSFLSHSCYHCKTPPCVAGCPASAIVKREKDGIVLVDPSLCLGEEACGLCKESCPYSVPEFNSDPNHAMEKCDFCSERADEGKKPICVEACPMRALDSGDLEELISKYGEGREAAGFNYSPEAKPSIVMKKR